MQETKLQRKLSNILGAAAILAMCLMFWISVMWSAAQQPQKFPSPADPAAVRMMIVGQTLQIVAPNGQVTQRPSMDKSHTVIEISLQQVAK